MHIEAIYYSTLVKSKKPSNICFPFSLCSPWLIEINASPAIGPSTSVTTRMVPQLLRDILAVTTTGSQGGGGGGGGGSGSGGAGGNQSGKAEYVTTTAVCF